MTQTILAPTRGGRASYPNQDQVIRIAEERNAEILFLYVTDVRFLGHTASPILVDIETEIDEMGEFLLTMAQERARKAGVKAKITVRRGAFRQVLREIIAEQEIHAVVLGSSSEGTGFTTHEYIEELSAEMSAKTGIEFIVVHEGKILNTYKPGSKQEAEEKNGA
jgi:nucleotide-binding universal stress UspA family protein